MTEPRTIGSTANTPRGTAHSRAIGSISYDRDQLLSLSASPLAAASIPDPGRLAAFAPVFAASSPADVQRADLDSAGPVGLALGISSMDLNAAETGTPMLRPVPDKAIFRQITSLVELDPSLMKPVTAEEMEFCPDMEEAVETSDTPVSATKVAKDKGMDVEVVPDVGETQDRRGSLRPSADPFVPNDTQAERRASQPDPERTSALAKPIHGLPDRPTLCALQPNLPRWALSPSNAALGSIAPEYTMSPPNNPGQDGRKASSVLMNEVSSWRSTAGPGRERMSVAQAGQGQLQMGEEGRGSLSMTPWSRRMSAAEGGPHKYAIQTTASQSILGGSTSNQAGDTALAAFTFGGSQDASFVDASPRRLPLAGGAGGFSLSPETTRVPGSISSSGIYAMGSFGAGGAVKVPRRTSMGDVLGEGTGLLGAVPMQGPGAYK